MLIDLLSLGFLSVGLYGTYKALRGDAEEPKQRMYEGHDVGPMLQRLRDQGDEDVIALLLDLVKHIKRLQEEVKDE